MSTGTNYGARLLLDSAALSIAKQINDDLCDSVCTEWISLDDIRSQAQLDRIKDAVREEIYEKLSHREAKNVIELAVRGGGAERPDQVYFEAKYI